MSTLLFVMRKFNDPIKDFGYFVYRWTSPFVDLLQLKTGILNFHNFFKDMFIYSKMKGAEPINILDIYPILHEKTSETPFDSHYFYQDIWAFKKILHTKPKSHVDVGSRIIFVGLLTAITKTTFIDIRPLNVKLEKLQSFAGSILSMPYEDNSVFSLSSLHVAEHIGLGRYGDPLDPLGTKKACKELSRILAPGGNLFFSLPVGKPRLCFNAHRIHSPKQIINYFKDLQLVELSGIDDNGNFITNIDINILSDSHYACGLFWFTKKKL